MGILLVSIQEDYKVIRKDNVGDRECATGEGVQIMLRLNSAEKAREDLHSNYEWVGRYEVSLPHPVGRVEGSRALTFDQLGEGGVHTFTDAPHPFIMKSEAAQSIAQKLSVQRVKCFPEI